MYNNIKFKHEDVREDSLPFLDWAVHTEENRSLNSEVNRKPTHRSVLQFDSHHKLEHKLEVIRSLNHWAKTVSTKTVRKEKEQRHIRGELKTCGYPNCTFVRTSDPEQSERRRHKNITTSLFLMLQEHLKDSGGSLINIISQSTLNPPTHWGKNLSI